MTVNGNYYQNGGVIHAETGTIDVGDGFVQKGDMYGDTGTIHVGGDYHQQKGTLEIGNSTFTVDGDYTLAEIQNNEDGSVTYNVGNGSLKMQDDEGHFTVGGDFCTRSNSNAAGNVLTAGTLELKGNFTQLKGYYTNNFKARDHHITMLTGDETQTISFENPSNSKFNQLQIRKDRFKNGDFVFENTPIPANQLVLLYDNLSFLNTESALTGQVVTVAGQAANGTAPYTYAFYARLAGDTEWYVIKGDFDDVVYATFVPTAVGTYEVKSVAKDDDGTMMEKIMTINVQKGEGKKAGWEKDGSQWKYYGEFGAYCVNQWKVIKGKTYHFDASGYMQTGWYKEGNVYYYLKADGSMAVNEWVENGKYYLDNNGHWGKDAVAKA